MIFKWFCMFGGPASTGGLPTSEQAGAVEGVGGGINPSPRSLDYRISILDCLLGALSRCSTCPEAQGLGGYSTTRSGKRPI